MVNIGLTLSEAKTYLALTQIGAAQMGPISRATGTQKTHLYQTLHSLEKKCLIEKEINAVTKYKAVPPSEAVDTLIKGRQKQIFQLKAKAKAIVRNLEVKQGLMPQIKIQQKAQFKVVPGKQVVLNRLKESLQKSQVNVDVVTTQIRFSSAIKEFFSEYKKALVRGVKIRIVTEDHLPDEAVMKMVQKLSKRPVFQVRWLLSSSLEAIMTIVDKKEAYVTLSATADLAESPALWSNNNCIIAVLQNYFEDKWNRSVSNNTNETLKEYRFIRDQVQNIPQKNSVKTLTA